MLVNVVKLDATNVVNINVEIYKIDSTFFNVLNFNVDVHNVIETLIWRYPTRDFIQT